MHGRSTIKPCRTVKVFTQRRLTQLYIGLPKRANVVLLEARRNFKRASVGSTDASASLPARVGVADPRAQVLTFHCPQFPLLGEGVNELSIPRYVSRLGRVSRQETTLRAESCDSGGMRTERLNRQRGSWHHA
jgi:hypothetical protein